MRQPTAQLCPWFLDPCFWDLGTDITCFILQGLRVQNLQIRNLLCECFLSVFGICSGFAHKTPPKNKKPKKKQIACIFSVFFFFFSYFRGRAQGGGFCIFFVFPALGPDGNANPDLVPESSRAINISAVHLWVVGEGFFCGKLVETLLKVCGKFEQLRFIASGKGAEILRRVAGIWQKSAETFLR